jgi:glucan 1,3-beta-glucosidase
LWSYSLGLQLGYIPTDPRKALGICKGLGVTGTNFDGNYLPWQTGGAGAGTIDPASVAAFPYPPATISNVAAGAMAFLPTYAQSGQLSTLPPATPTAKATKSVDYGDGWYNSADNSGMATPIASCTYAPDAWSALEVGAPTAACGGGLGQGVVGGPAAAPTAAAPAAVGAGAGAATTTTRGAATAAAGAGAGAAGAAGAGAGAAGAGAAGAGGVDPAVGALPDPDVTAR